MTISRPKSIHSLPCAPRAWLRRSEGFTLIELLVVVLIIGILAAIAIPVFNGQRNKAKNAQAQSAVRNALTAAKAFYLQSEDYTGFTAGVLNQYEGSLAATEPTATSGPGATSQLVPGKNAEPTKIWIGNGTSGGAPTTTLMIAAISTGDSWYCIEDNGTTGAEFRKGTGTFTDTTCTSTNVTGVGW